LLEPKCVQKFAESYALHSKTKAKKFTKALELANNASNRTFPDAKLEKTIKSKKKLDQK
jgi:hypothetical protein